MSSLSIGSLFAGIGGIDLGLERAGLGPVLWQVEQDPFCRSVLAHHWPEAERYDDVCSVGAGELQPVNLICGGFPCQDLSVAGKGAGLAGERSGLWREYARVVRELRPEWVVVENVTALLARGLDVVLGDLAACGYDATWDCIPAAAVGAPHRRDRIFVVARRISDAQLADADSIGRSTGRRRGVCEPREVADSPGCRGPMAHPNGSRPQRERSAGISGAEIADPDGCNLPPWPPAPNDLHAWRRVPEGSKPAFCRLANELPAELDWARGPRRRRALKAYGNAVCPAVAEVIGMAIAQAMSSQWRIER